MRRFRRAEVIADDGVDSALAQLSWSREHGCYLRSNSQPFRRSWLTATAIPPVWESRQADRAVAVGVDAVGMRNTEAVTIEAPGFVRRLEIRGQLPKRRTKTN